MWDSQAVLSSPVVKVAAWMQPSSCLWDQSAPPALAGSARGPRPEARGLALAFSAWGQPERPHRLNEAIRLLLPRPPGPVSLPPGLSPRQSRQPAP